MSRSLTTNATTEKNKLSGARSRHLLEIDGLNGTVYYSDQNITVGTNTYIQKVISLGQIRSQAFPGEDEVRTGQLNLSLSNFPRIDQIIRPNDSVRLFLWFDGTLASDKITLFKGIADELIEWDIYTISFTATDIGESFNKNIGEPLTLSDFPSADIDDVGKIKPIVYGDIKNHICLEIVSAATTNLDGDIDNAVTTIPVKSTTLNLTFPSTGSIKIEDEVIPYTGTTATSFTGATRGGGAAAHTNGQVVLQVPTSNLEFMVANHAVKAITNPRVVPFGLSADDSVPIDAGSIALNINDSGIATADITAADVLGIRADVVTTSSDIVADHLGGNLIVDVEGYADDTPAHYTDSAGGLIEEPWDVIHHLIENHSNGAVDNNIDLAGSFQDAEDDLPNTYKFAFVINQKVKLNNLLAMLAQQTRCRFVWETGVGKLNRVRFGGPEDKFINGNNNSNIVLEGENIHPVKIRRRNIDEIVNDVEVKYNLNLTLGGWFDPGAYRGSTVATDSTSITSFGTHQRTWLAFAIGNNATMAEDLRDFLLLFWKNPKRELTLPFVLNNIELERGDIIKIDIDLLGISLLVCEIVETDYIPPGNMLKYIITALEVG